MFGGFSSKNPIASFAPPATPPAPRTSSEWKASLLEVKSLYLERQYKQCAARSTEILKKATEPVRRASTTTPAMDQANGAIDRFNPSTRPISTSMPPYLTSSSAEPRISTRATRLLCCTRPSTALSSAEPLCLQLSLCQSFPSFRLARSWVLTQLLPALLPFSWDHLLQRSTCFGLMRANMKLQDMAL